MDARQLADLSTLGGQLLEAFGRNDSEKNLGRELRLFSQDARRVVAKPRRTPLTKTRLTAARRAGKRLSRWSASH